MKILEQAQMLSERCGQFGFDLAMNPLML